MRSQPLLLVTLALALCAPRMGLAKPSAEPAQSTKTRDVDNDTGKTANKGVTRSKAAKRRANKRRVNKARKRRRARAARVRRRKQAQRRRIRHRRHAHRRRANRPSGWSWPPTPAMKTRGAECKEALADLSLVFKRAPTSRGVATPIYVPSMRFAELELVPTFRKPPFVIDCHLARALRLVAPALTEAGVKSLRFSSIYDYRRAIVGGKKKQSLSRHSYGLAVDIFEVEGADGEILKVEGRYHGSELLKKVETIVNESGYFRLVLSPANDPRSHSDHLHFEADVTYDETLRPRAAD